MAPRAFTLQPVLRIAFLLLAPGLLSGCGTVGEARNVLREASETLIKIATLGADRSPGSADDELYAVEDKIHDACRDLLTSAKYKLNSEEVPLETQIGAALNAEQCQRTVREVQHELESLDSQPLSPDP